MMCTWSSAPCSAQCGSNSTVTASARPWVEMLTSTRPARPSRPSTPPCAGRVAHASDVAADDEGLLGLGALEGAEGLQIGHVPGPRGGPAGCRCYRAPPAPAVTDSTTSATPRTARPPPIAGARSRSDQQRPAAPLAAGRPAAASRFYRGTSWSPLSAVQRPSPEPVCSGLGHRSEAPPLRSGNCGGQS